MRPRLRGWIHASAVPLALACTLVLWRSAQVGGVPRLPAVTFGVCFVGLYTASSLYHVPNWSSRVKKILGRFDVAMIPLAIAGTFTPIAFHALTGGWRSTSLVFAWLVALIGSAVGVSPIEAPRWLGTAGYIAGGWLTVVPFGQIVQALPWQGSGLIALGGILYTIGAIIYARRRPDPSPRWFGYHEIFHILVVAAFTAHYFAIWRYVLPTA